MTELFPVCVITDTVLQKRFSHFELTKFAIESGVRFIQYRNKSYQKECDLKELIAIVQMCKDAGAVLIVNDNWQAAIDSQAHGVHLGITDEPPNFVRKQMPDNAIIGLTIHSEIEAEQVHNLSYEYAGVGPFALTSTKKMGLSALGEAGFKRIATKIDRPIFSIGGMNAENAGKAIRAGAYGVAVISAFCNANDPVSEGKRIIDAVVNAKS